MVYRQRVLAQGRERLICTSGSFKTLDVAVRAPAPTSSSSLYCSSKKVASKGPRTLGTQGAGRRFFSRFVHDSCHIPSGVRVGVGMRPADVMGMTRDRHPRGFRLSTTPITTAPQQMKTPTRGPSKGLGNVRGGAVRGLH